MVDDATSQALARFAGHDSTEENLRLLWSYLERFGRPAAFYTDKGGLFCVNQPRRQEPEEAWEEARTQIGRALKELGIGWVAAHWPQARGRIERFFGTAQDRLVKGLRLAPASTLEAANAYLEREYLPLWNQRFVVESAKGINAHRPLRAEHDLAAILSHVEERSVANDYTLRYAGQFYQVARTDIRPGVRGGVVIPPQAGIQAPSRGPYWIPAFAGMTARGRSASCAGAGWSADAALKNKGCASIVSLARYFKSRY